MSLAVTTPVLIVGGGPVGLSLSIWLAQLGLPHLLVEQCTEPSSFPKGRAVSVRSMEIYRQWGLEEEITRVGLPRESSLAFYTGASLTAADFSRIVTAPAARPQLPSPTYTLMCSQDRLEPVLRSAAQRWAPGQVRFGVELTGLDPDRDGVTAEVLDHTTGTRSRIRAAHLVAADGAHSTVRRALGIAMSGPPAASHNLNILFEADLSRPVADRLSAVYTITRPGLHGSFLAVDNDRRWLFNLIVDDQHASTLPTYSDAECVTLVRSATGITDLPVHLLGRKLWRASARVAQVFTLGRVLLAGDAAHLMTPYGGFGMNCGIADVHNLGWKLAAVHAGWARSTLLDTYEPERRPVAVDSAAESHRRLLAALTAHRTGQPPAAQPSEGLVLGYHYDSTAVIPDGTPPPEGDLIATYHPTARPGHRAPHVWLRGATGRISTLDLIRTGYTLLAAPLAGPAAHAATGMAHRLRIPLSTYQVGDSDLADPDGTWLHTYGLTPYGAVLIRPDGHIAWRNPDTTAPGPSVDTIVAHLRH